MDKNFEKMSDTQSNIESDYEEDDIVENEEEEYIRLEAARAELRQWADDFPTFEQRAVKNSKGKLERRPVAAKDAIRNANETPKITYMKINKFDGKKGMFCSKLGPNFIAFDLDTPADIDVNDHGYPEQQQIVYFLKHLKQCDHNVNITYSPSEGHCHILMALKTPLAENEKLNRELFPNIEIKTGNNIITIPNSVYEGDKTENLGKQYFTISNYIPKNKLTYIEDITIQDVSLREIMFTKINVNEIFNKDCYLFGKQYELKYANNTYTMTFSKEILMTLADNIKPKGYHYNDLWSICSTLKHIGIENKCEDEIFERISKRLEILFVEYDHDDFAGDWTKWNRAPPDYSAIIYHCLKNGLDINSISIKIDPLDKIRDMKVILEENNEHKDCNSWLNVIKWSKIKDDHGREKTIIANVEEVTEFLIHNCLYIVSDKMIYCRYKDVNNKEWLSSFTIEQYKQTFKALTWDLLQNVRQCRYGKIINNKNEPFTDSDQSYINLYKPFHIYWDEEKISKLVLEPNYEEKKIEYIKMYNDLVSTLFEENSDWYYNWICGVINGEKTGINIVMTSKNEGVGKGILCRANKEMLKGMCISFSKYTGRTGLFERTFSLMNKHLVVLDEIGEKSISNSDYEMFKSLTTENLMTVTPLYSESIEIPNECNFIINCNDISYLKIPAGSRRFCINSIKAKRMDEDLSEKWGTSLADPLFGYIIYNYIKSTYKFDRKKLREFSDVSKEYLSLQIIESLPLAIRFILDEKYPKAIELKQDDIIESNTNLFNQFKAWRKQENTDRITPQSFSRLINPFFESCLTTCNNHRRIFNVKKLTELIIDKKMNPNYFIQMNKQEEGENQEENDCGF